jgi:hypothetical protein
MYYKIVNINRSDALRGNSATIASIFRGALGNCVNRSWAEREKVEIIGQGREEGREK